MPAFDGFVRQVGEGKVLHNENTSMKVLELLGPRRADPLDGIRPTGPVGDALDAVA